MDVINLFISIIFRVLVFSYNRFVSKNIDDEVSPWVNMMVSIAYCPSFEFDRHLDIHIHILKC